MLHSLRPHERVNRGQRLRVGGRYDHLASARKIVIAVRDHVALFRHFRGAGHRFHVYELRRGEVAGLKGVLDEMKMRTNLRDAERVVHVSKELDAPAVREGIEGVRRCALVDAHGHLATILHCGKGGIRTGPLSRAR